MADNSAAPAPRKGRRWLRWVGGIVGVLVVLLVVAYFVVTSAGFLKGVILPKASAAMNAQITVADASIHPFSGVELSGLKVQTTGSEPLVTAQQAIVRYSLSDILKGNYKVEEIKLVAPVINLVENPDGTSNLDPLLKQTPESKGETKTGKKPETPSQPSKPLQVDLQRLVITDGIIRRTTLHKDGKRDLLELAPLNLNVTNIKNGQTGKLELASNLALDQNPPAPGTNAQLAAKLAGNFDLGLTADLKPENVNGNLKIDVTKAGGGMAEANGLAAQLDCNATMKEIKLAALRLLKNNAKLGEVRVSGPLDLNTLEGRLNVEVHSIDRQALNLAGAPMGMDFNSTVINSTNQIELAKNAKVITVAGQFNLDRFSVTRTNQTTPPLDLRSVYHVMVDLPAQAALLRELTINGVQNQQPLLRANLAQPMSVSWGTNSQSLPDSSFNLSVTNFNLADWKAFVGDYQGKANLTLDVVSRNSGKALTFDFASLVDELTAQFGSNKLSQATVRLQARGQVDQLNKVNLEDSRFELAQRNQSALTAGASGQVMLNTKDADLQVSMETALPRLLEVAPQPDISVSSGNARMKAHVVQKQQAQTITGNMALLDFTGAFGTNKFANLGAAMDLDVTKQNDLVQIRKAAGTLRQGNNPAATFDVSGTADLSTNQPQADLQVALEAILPQLLQAMPQPDLKATAGTARIKAHVVQQGKDQSVDGNLALTGFTGNYGNYKLEDFGTTVDLDASMKDQQVQLRKFSGALTAANQPAGRFDLKGTVGLTNQATQVDFALADLNQNALRPFLAPSLGEKKLVSVNLNAKAAVQYDPQRESAIKADAQMTNLVVSEPGRPLPATPLEIKLLVDTALKQKLVDLRQCVLALAPTERASNAIELKGQIDMSQPDAIQGALKLVSEAFDVTPYYDLFAASQNTNAPAKPQAQAQAPAPAPAPAAPVAGQSAEPQPIKLPIGKFTLDANIGRFYLREIEMTNLQTSLKLGATNVDINPLQLALNGAPVSGSVALNLGVPGYQYNIASKAGAVPLAPLANSFVAEYKGRAKGDMGWDIQIQGAGTTGASLKQSLQGKFDYILTNANVVLVTGTNKVAQFMKKVIQPLAANLRLPELTESPVSAAATHVTMGNGNINIEQFNIITEAFVAGTQGVIPIADEITNSPLPGLPVNLAVRRDLMQRIRLVPKDTPADAQYVALPALYKVGGTIGAPDPKFDAMALGLYAARIAAGMSGLGNTQAGNLLQGFSNILGQKQSTNTTATTGTNAPATQGGQLLQGLQGILGGKKSTATPAPNAPAASGNQLAQSGQLPQGLQGIFGGSQPTAATAAVTNAAATNALSTQGNPLLQSLQGILSGNKAVATNAAVTNALTAKESQVLEKLKGLLGGSQSANTNAADTNAPATLQSQLIQKLKSIISASQSASTNATDPNAQATQRSQLLQKLQGILSASQLGTNLPGTNATVSQGGQLLQGLQGILGGSKSAATNAPSTNQPAAFNPFDLFKK